MKSGFFLILLFVSASHGFHDFNTTFYDYLKDGFDMVYKYSRFLQFVTTKGEDSSKVEFDLHLRKSIDAGKIVMYLTNVNITGEQEQHFTAKDVDNLALPIVIDLEGEAVHVTEEDTNFSIMKKDETLKYIMHFTHVIRKHIIANVKPGETKFVMKRDSTLHYGECDTENSIEEVEGKIRIRIFTKRSDCDGHLHPSFATQIRKYGATDIEGESTLSTGVEYDKETGQFFRFFDQATGTLVREGGGSFNIAVGVPFIGYQKIENVFDETKNTKK